MKFMLFVCLSLIMMTALLGIGFSQRVQVGGLPVANFSSSIGSRLDPSGERFEPNSAGSDKDLTELVLGVQPYGFSSLANLVNSSCGIIVDTLRLGEDIAAVLVDVPSASATCFASEAMERGLARYAEPNSLFKIDLVPDDPDWKFQWGPAMIGADYAWNTTTGNATNVIVAIIDTGVDYTHEDLAANYVAGGRDWVNNDADPMDDNGHGTMCAGIIAAAAGNKLGMAGLAQVQIMAEKALDYEGHGWEFNLASAIRHATDTMDNMSKRAKIMNLSWGASTTPSMLIHEAVKYAYDHGVLVVASAGNDGTSVKNYPAAFDEVVAVTATDESDNYTYFTSYGDWVELAAPGESIYSAFPGDSYVFESGTSFSAPHVVGVAALVWSAFPLMTRDQVRMQLRSTAQDKGTPGFDVYFGYGRLNAKRAVEQALPEHDLVAYSWQKPAYVKPGDLYTANVSVLNFGRRDESNISLQLLIDGKVNASAQIDFLESGAIKTVSCSAIAYLKEGTYNLTCHVVPVTGEADEGNNVLSFTSFTVRLPKTRTVPTNYRTIQSAIDDSYPEDIINVSKAIYHELLTIDKPLILQGDHALILANGSTVVRVTADNVCFSGFQIDGGSSGVYLTHCSNVTLRDNVIEDNGEGIVLDYSSEVTLRNNTMIGNQGGLQVFGTDLADLMHDIDKSNTVDGKPVYYLVNHHNESIISDAGYVAAVNSTRITVKNLTLKGDNQTVLFVYTNNSTIENVTANGVGSSILLISSDANSIRSNIIANVTDCGIDMVNSKANNIEGNLIVVNSDAYAGIRLYGSQGCTVSNNTVIAIDRSIAGGILSEFSGVCTFTRNIILNCSEGMVLDRSGFSVLKGNNMTGNAYSFGVYGYDISDFILNIDEQNTVNGKRIYYLFNQTNLVVDSGRFPDMGYLGIINSTKVILRDLELTGNGQGVLLACVNGCIVENATVFGNKNGVYIQKSQDCKINCSEISAQAEVGVELDHSSDCIIDNNSIREGSKGVDLYASTNSTVRRNSFANQTKISVQLVYSSSGVIGDNTMKESQAGVMLENCSRVNVGNNTILNCGSGILLDNSGGNNITRNVMCRGIGGISFGIGLESSDHNAIIENVVFKISHCLVVKRANANILYHNSFIDYVQDLMVAGYVGNNTWDNGWEEGNYWSGYHGNDTNHDGIGDTDVPYSATLDRYPLMAPYVRGDVTHDGKVDIRDISLIAASWITTPGHPRWHIHANIAPENDPDDYINILDIALCAQCYGTEWAPPSIP
jgi:thermitase